MYCNFLEKSQLSPRIQRSAAGFASLLSFHGQGWRDHHSHRSQQNGSKFYEVRDSPESYKKTFDLCQLHWRLGGGNLPSRRKHFLKGLVPLLCLTAHISISTRSVPVRSLSAVAQHLGCSLTYWLWQWNWHNLVFFLWPRLLVAAYFCFCFQADWPLGCIMDLDYSVRSRKNNVGGGRKSAAAILSSKASVCDTRRLIKTLVAWQIITESWNPHGFEVQCGECPDKDAPGICWTHNSGSSRQTVVQNFFSPHCSPNGCTG